MQGVPKQGLQISTFNLYYFILAVNLNIVNMNVNLYNNKNSCQSLPLDFGCHPFIMILSVILYFLIQAFLSWLLTTMIPIVNLYFIFVYCVLVYSAVYCFVYCSR